VGHGANRFKKINDPSKDDELILRGDAMIDDEDQLKLAFVLPNFLC
jgi:hypothetical protein